MDLRELNAREEQVVNRHPWELARLKVANDIFRQQNLSNIEGFLDLGCGDSFFINSFHQLNPLNVPFFGVDINFEPPLLEKLNQENPAIKFFKTLDDLKDNYNGKISVVFLMDVIEHIENDIEFLKMVCQYPFITKDTIFIISVPAFQSLFASHDVFLGHYRRYDNAMLKNHIEQAGMQTLKLGYFFTSLLLPRWIQKTKERIKPIKETTGLVEWNGSKFKTRLITSVLLLDYKIMRLLSKIGIKMPGLSNFATCKPLAS